MLCTRTTTLSCLLFILSLDFSKNITQKVLFYDFFSSAYKNREFVQCLRFINLPSIMFQLSPLVTFIQLIIKDKSRTFLKTNDSIHI